MYTKAVYSGIRAVTEVSTEVGGEVVNVNEFHSACVRVKEA